jgi:hypothetical protein
MDLDHLTITDWRIIKQVSDRPLSLQELKQVTPFPYYTLRYHCKKLHHWRILEKKKSACVIYSMTSSNVLRQQIMDRYYDIMEV